MKSYIVKRLAIGEYGNKVEKLFLCSTKFPEKGDTVFYDGVIGKYTDNGGVFVNNPPIYTHYPYPKLSEMIKVILEISSSDTLVKEGEFIQ